MREEMRKPAAILLSLFLMSGTAFADTPKDGDAQPADTAKKTTKPAKSATTDLAEQIEALRKKLETFANPADVRSGAPWELDALDKVKRLFDDLQAVDAAPTPSQQAAVADLQRDTTAVTERWKSIASEIATLNAQLRSAGLEPLKLP
jgi:peptidoglycan hydrolase CwlO-like protein